MKDFNEWRDKWRDVELILPRTPEPEPYCGVYWIIATCWIAIGVGVTFGIVLWLVLA